MSTENRGGDAPATPSLWPLVDRMSDILGQVAAWMFFAVGGMISYEVVARYVFLAPTIWAEEMSRFFQIWATYLAAAYVLRHQQLIVIEILTLRLNERLRSLAQAAALVIIILFCAVAVFYGTHSMMESITLKRASSTMLSVPLWMTEIAIPLGFGTLMLQALAELGALWRRRPAHPR